eukprot:11821898-Alexandrium_andersonii.AAC.1
MSAQIASEEGDKTRELARALGAPGGRSRALRCQGCSRPDHDDRESQGALMAGVMVVGSGHAMRARPGPVVTALRRYHG